MDGPDLKGALVTKDVEGKTTYAYKGIIAAFRWPRKVSSEVHWMASRSPTTIGRAKGGSGAVSSEAMVPEEESDGTELGGYSESFAWA